MLVGYIATLVDTPVFYDLRDVMQAPSKASHLSNRINEEIKRVAAVMGGVCLLGAALSTIWNDQVPCLPGCALCFARVRDVL